MKRSGRDERGGGSGQSRKPTAEDAIIGQRLKEARKRAGRNQGWLADELGITYQQLGKYERGESSLKVWMLAKASGALGIAPSALLGELSATGFAEAPARYEAGFDPEQQEFQQAFERAVALWPKVKRAR